MRGTESSSGGSGVSSAEPRVTTAFTTESGDHGAARVRRRPWACATVAASASEASRTATGTAPRREGGRNMGEKPSIAGNARGAGSGAAGADPHGCGLQPFRVLGFSQVTRGERDRHAGGLGLGSLDAPAIQLEEDQRERQCDALVPVAERVV